MISPVRSAVLLVLAGVALAACRRGSEPASLLRPSPEAPCPAEAPAPPILPYELPEHSLAEFWLSRAGNANLAVPWKRIEEQNRRMNSMEEHGWPIARWRLEQLKLDPERVRERLRARLEGLRAGVLKGERVLEDGERPLALLDELRGELEKLQGADDIRVAHRSTPIRCFPTDLGIYEKPWDLAFDVMQCAELRYGEPVRVAAKGSRYYYVWSTYTDGWVRPEDLSPALGPDDVRTYLQPSRFVVVQQHRLAIWGDLERRVLLGAAPFGLRLPLVSSDGGRLAVWAPSPSGLVTGWVLPPLGEAAPVTGASVGYPQLTRAALIDRAFRLLNTPYGWGGTGDKRDCSGLMMDLLAGFGLEIPRNTSHQSLAGTRQVDVASLDEPAKVRAIEAEARHGLVLLYMPHHIMLYIGRDGSQLYAFHLFSGYLTPCKPRGETMQRVNRTVVSSLELGRGGSRRAFIQRITRLVVFDGLDDLQEH